MSSNISSEFIDSVRNHQYNKPSKRSAKTSKSSRAVKKTLAEKPVPAPKLLKEKKVYHFNPTEGEDWVTKEVNLGMIAHGVFQVTIRPLVMRLLKEPGKQLLATLDPRELKSVGDIEKFSLKMMKLETAASEERKEELHNKLKGVLKVFAEKGITGALSSIVAFIKNP